jgi:hypothetical protein
MIEAAICSWLAWKTERLAARGSCERLGECRKEWTNRPVLGKLGSSLTDFSALPWPMG